MLILFQVFVCANNARNVGTVHGALVRGLLSMFDACAVERDPRSVDHLACTEVGEEGVGRNYLLSR